MGNPQGDWERITKRLSALALWSSVLLFLLLIGSGTFFHHYSDVIFGKETKTDREIKALQEYDTELLEYLLHYPKVTDLRAGRKPSKEEAAILERYRPKKSWWYVKSFVVRELHRRERERYRKFGPLFNGRHE